MNKNLYFEDINEGMEIPTIKKNPTTQQLVKYAGASGDFYQIHYDMEYAKNNGISFKVIEPNSKEFIIKSYADNFTKN